MNFQFPFLLLEVQCAHFVLHFIDPKNSLMVGDSPTDMLTAKRAGITPIGITTGIHLKEELLKAGTHKTIEKMRELIPFIK